MTRSSPYTLPAALMAGLATQPILAEETTASRIYSGNLLYDIQNPFAYIPRVQFENHFDTGEGPNDASTYRLRTRPIIPVDLTDDIGLRTRTTINMTYQSSPYTGSPNQLGFGDMDMEFYLTPTRSLAHDVLLVGAGPMFHLPTATQSHIGLHQWGVGPAAAVIWQPSTVHALRGWTLSLYANQLFGFAASTAYPPLSRLFVQPTVTYTTESEMSLAMDTQPTYDWTRDQWTVPINFGVSTLVKPAGQNIVLTLGGRYYAERGFWDPKWGAQFNINFLFPR